MADKKIVKFLSLLIVGTWLVPSFVLAANSIRPGTADYLVGNGLTEQQITPETATEKREPFISLTGETVYIDPIGDVLSRVGTYPQINYGWGDLTKVELKKNNEKQCWQFGLNVAQEIPPNTPSLQANFILYIDRDGILENNAPQGVRINTDYEVSIKYDIVDKENPGWETGLRWYNKETDFWAVNKTTASTFEMKGSNLSVCVPFAEIPAEVIPTWRVAAAISDGGNTQIDVAPGAGFPPPLGETYATWQPTIDQPSTESLSLLNWNALMIIVAVIGLIVLVKIVFWIVEKRKLKK
ncbi:MAG: hypothetical protein V1664_02980 [Candidatus Uhrbacteria bacterium]